MHQLLNFLGTHTTLNFTKVVRPIEVNVISLVDARGLWMKDELTAGRSPTADGGAVTRHRGQRGLSPANAGPFLERSSRPGGCLTPPGRSARCVLASRDACLGAPRRVPLRPAGGEAEIRSGGWRCLHGRKRPVKGAAVHVEQGGNFRSALRLLAAEQLAGVFDLLPAF